MRRAALVAIVAGLVGCGDDGGGTTTTATGGCVTPAGGTRLCGPPALAYCRSFVTEDNDRTRFGGACARLGAYEDDAGAATTTTGEVQALRCSTEAPVAAGGVVTIPGRVVPGGGTVTAKNERTTISISASVADNGAFSVALEAESGDRVELTGAKPGWRRCTRELTIGG